MEKESNLIVIPWDFSQVAENALVHGAKIARMVDNELRLLHIVDKKLDSAKKEQLTNRLNETAAKTERIYNVKVDSFIMEGNIFTAISKYVTDIKANLVLMGTHGMKGMQKITGSWALKVIAGSKVPFIVVQDPPEDMSKYQNILFPIDFKTEQKEKLHWAIFMGKYFDSRVHILQAGTQDKSLLKKQNINLNFAIKFLTQNRIDYEIHTVEKSGNFAKDIIRFSKDKKIDLVIIMTTKNLNFSDYIVGAQEQYIIGNSSHIPVMCINPKANYAKVAQYMYG
jgi:nucleotide-binding universal stress UspA family protein